MGKKNKKHIEVMLVKLGIVEKADHNSKSNGELNHVQKVKITVTVMLTMAFMYLVLYFIARFNATHNVMLFSIPSFISIIITIIIVLLFCIIGIYVCSIVTRKSGQR